MAGYPPPYPPPPGTPFGSPYGSDPRMHARMIREQMKAQARAQKAAFRTQRMMYRNQVRAMRRTSILGPLLIVAIGVVLLLIRLDRLPFSEFAFWYGHWWPLLFVAAGLILALEWGYDHYSHHEGVPFVRRGIGGGVVLLLILLAIAGVFNSTVEGRETFLSHGLVIDGENFEQMFGDRHDFEQQIDQPFPAGTTLNVDNPHGDVAVVGKSDDNEIHIVVNKQVYSWDESNASQRADSISPHVSLSGGTLTVMAPSYNGSHSDLSITIPETAQTTISASRGDITVSDLKAPVNLTADHGDIQADRIGGSLSVHVGNNGSSFAAHAIQGDVTLRGHADNLDLTNVTGAVSFEGEFYGDTHFENLAGPVGFRTSRTQLTLGRLDGMIDISSDEEMTGSQIEGPLELHTRSRNISFERVAGSVNISNSNGTVDLTSSAPLGNVNIANNNGEVTVTVPENAGLTVDAETKGGEMQNDLALTPTTSGERTTLNGSVGDGAARLNIVTNHSDITIHRGLVEPPAAPGAPLTPAPPAAPAPPATRRGGGSKRLVAPRQQ